jgi:hypothetical protein
LIGGGLGVSAGPICILEPRVAQLLAAPGILS